MSKSSVKNRKPYAIAMLVVITWFLITGIFGPLFGKLSSVQENNNSSFLPKGAEATKEITVFPSNDGKAILANVPLDGNAISKVLSNEKPVLPAVVEAIRNEVRPLAKSLGVNSYVTGPGGLLGDLFGAFGTLDSSLLLTTLGVVALILIVVYRSPVLWIIPLLSALFALSTAGGIVYLLAKHNIIDVDGQSQGILSVLVIGAATDYALLLIARYREELHHTENRFVAMRAAYKGVWEPILASGSTVSISLLILLFSQLTNTAGLGPIGAIGIVCAMITILTLLPAFLLVFGRWIFWPRIPRNDGDDHVMSGPWSKVANTIGRNPRKAWIITGAALLA
ncbi:MAG: MMPL family transporter, partial [Actinobacteria bacterium]|nr:MMPL family transporter [Actinomycetota bacterium]